jgi:hypothetical protein
MVLVLREIRSFPRLEQEVTSQHLKNHARVAPYVCRRIVLRADEHFRGTVLSCLNQSGKVMVDPASVAQISDFQLEIICQLLAQIELDPIVAFMIYINSLCFVG